MYLRKMKHPTDGSIGKIPGCHHEGPVLLPQCRLLNVVVAADDLAVDDAARAALGAPAGLQPPVVRHQRRVHSRGYRDNLEPDLREHWHPLWLLLVHCQQIQQYSPENVNNCYTVITVFPLEEKIYKTYTTHLPSAVKPPFSVQIGILNPKSSTT